MPLKIETKLPYANVRGLAIDARPEVPEVRFTADPHGASACLWFCFRLLETEPEAVPEGGRVKLILKYFDSLHGASDPGACRPVYRPQGQDWVRARPGKLELREDGQHDVSWEIEHPAPSTEVAFCFPYGQPELKLLLQKTKGYWRSDTAGLTQRGRPLVRLSNAYGDPGGDLAGVYLVARQHSGETPGSWVLEGVLKEFARAKQHRQAIWAVPFLNTDGIERGDYGVEHGREDFDACWGAPPGRHETLVVQQDVLRWKGRCRPALALDFHAPGASETAGVYCRPPGEAAPEEVRRVAAGWSGVFKDALGADLCAPEFLHQGVAEEPAGGRGTNFRTWFAREIGAPALAFEIPYTAAGDQLLTRNGYRDIGKRIATGIIRRLKQA